MYPPKKWASLRWACVAPLSPDGGTLIFARLRVRSFDPEGLPPAGEIHVAKVGFSKTGPVSISMDTWPVGAACRVGWPKFSKAGESQLLLPLGKVTASG